MKDDPSTIWSSEYAERYEQANYGKGMAGFVLHESHKLIEKPFGPETHFARVLEVGSGSGVHLRYIRHAYDEYWMTDASTQMLDATKNFHFSPGKIRVKVEDATKLSFEDASFDRLIATHVLEHLYRPHEILREWARVLRPGGVMSIVLPCDPGLLWRLGRNFGPRQRARDNGLAYDYVMAREHVNSITNLVALIRYYFDNPREVWWPTKVPFSDINLIYAVTLRL